MSLPDASQSQRVVQIVPNPGSQTYMPPVPKFLYITRKIGSSEINHELKTHQFPFCFERDLALELAMYGEGRTLGLSLRSTPLFHSSRALSLSKPRRALTM